jgi:AhpD family alkylhydroperoxidase
MTTQAIVPEELVRALRSLDGAVWLDPRLRELVAVRTAQIDGCGDQLVEHARAALDLGETPERLIALADRDRSTVFTPKEQAALAFVDALAGTDAAAIDEARREAARFLDPVELAHLAFTCAAAAAWDRLVLAAGPRCG